MVKKLLNSLPRNKYIQIIASLEQVLNLNRTSYEDIIGRPKSLKNGFRKKIHRSHRGTFCTRIKITNTTQEEEVDVGNVVEETEEEGVEEATHKIESKRRKTTLKLLVSAVRRKATSHMFILRRNKTITS